MLRPIISQLKLQDEVLHVNPSNEEDVSSLAEKVRGIRVGLVAATAGLEGQMPLLGIEVARGQIGGGDLARVFNKLKEVGGSSHVLSSFAVLLQQDDTTRKRLNGKLKRFASSTGLEELFPILEESTRELRELLARGLEKTTEWLDLVNHSRWTKETPKLEVNTNYIRAALEAFRTEKQHALLEPFKYLFDTGGKLNTVDPAAARALFRCHVFTTSLIGFAGHVLELLEMLEEIERRCPRARLHWPAKFTQMLAKAANEQEDTNPLEIGGEQPHEPKYGKDADAEDPRDIFQQGGRKMYTLWGHLTSARGLFALKYGLVSVALWTPQVCKSSAFFIYGNRGLWALIMAQAGLGVYTGEQIASFLTRVVSTG